MSCMHLKIRSIIWILDLDGFEFSGLQIKLKGIIERSLIICATINICFASNLNETVWVTTFWNHQAFLKILNLLHLILLVVKLEQIIKYFILHNILPTENESFTIPIGGTNTMTTAKSIKFYYV